MTLSPVTGHRPHYTVFSVDIGVTDVTKNRRLFAVPSTTCSTLYKQLLCSFAVFSHPIDIQQALVQHTQSVSVPIRHPIIATKALYSHKLRDRHIIHRKYKIPGTYIRGILMRVASVGCFPGAWRQGSWHFQVASLDLQSSVALSLSALHYFPFLSKRSGWRTPPAERSALYIYAYMFGGDDFF